MTQEEKQLLLKDLCARLPYGVKVNLHNEICTLLGYFDDYVMLTANVPTGQQTNIANIKPYLRPLSSMTEDEKKVYHKLLQMSITVVMPNMVRKETSYIVDLEDDGDGLNHLYDWFNENHFDYRGLIPMGLALEAKEGMYES